MRKSSLGLLVAAFLFGLTTADVDARGHRINRHNFIWHNGKHYHHHVHKHHRKKHHRKHHRRPPPPPIVVAHIYIATQRMTVDINGWRYGDWQVSTAGRGYHTPNGVFRAFRLERVYFSKKYDNSPMPHSIFFAGGNAIHGTYHVRSLGKAVSHGCVRLLPQHAAELFALTEEYGMRQTQVIVSE